MTLLNGCDILGYPKCRSDLRFCESRDMAWRRRQHMLMAQITESFEDFLARVVRRAIPRLIVINGELPPKDDEDDLQAEDEDDLQAQNDKEAIALLLAELRMAVRLRDAIDNHIRFMVVACATSKAESLLDAVLGAPLPRPTWKEIGQALGVSAQAAHRKYGEAARANQASRGE